MSRGHRVGIVWLDTEAGLTLLPIEAGKPRPHDIRIDNTLAYGFAMDGARIRARRLPPQLSVGHVQVGTLPGDVMCKVSHALARHDADAVTVARWTVADEHRRRAADNRTALR